MPTSVEAKQSAASISQSALTPSGAEKNKDNSQGDQPANTQRYELYRDTDLEERIMDKVNLQMQLMLENFTKSIKTTIKDEIRNAAQRSSEHHGSVRKEQEAPNHTEKGLTPKQRKLYREKDAGNESKAHHGSKYAEWDEPHYRGGLRE
ncbi:hypothetical protein C0J52_19661 [Blattella germanica]|nr:hypothetical protein C0J52_19661 [Blattella germanica]